MRGENQRVEAMSQASQGSMFDALTCDPLDLIERGGDALNDRTRWPAKLAELYDIEYQCGLRRGLPPDEAATDATARTIMIADYLGGSSVYLPRGDELRRAVRDSEVFRRHRGNNHEELAREIGMTSTKLYELIAREKRRRQRKMQGRLFERDED
jgi:Mor family transcriptional regulator